jgi:hypothetical protein
MRKDGDKISIRMDATVTTFSIHSGMKHDDGTTTKRRGIY